MEARSFDHMVSSYELVVDEQFEANALHETRWLPFYLPQWSGRERSRANHRLVDGHLELSIAEDQHRWLPDIEGELRVSGIQTGCYAGPVGSRIGQHRTSDELVVVEEQPAEQLITPQFAAVELRARWEPRAGQMIAMFMIGFEDEPHRSGEICVLEIFGNEVTPETAVNGIGVKKWHDPDLADDFEKTIVPVDVREWNRYGVVWTSTSVTFFANGVEVKRVEQSPQYRLQLMIGIYDFGGTEPRLPPSPFQIDHVKVFEPVAESTSNPAR